MMPGKMSDLDKMPEKIMKSGHDSREPETKKRSNPSMMSENPKQKKGSRSNLGMMSKNLK